MQDEPAGWRAQLLSFHAPYLLMLLACVWAAGLIISFAILESPLALLSSSTDVRHRTTLWIPLSLT